MLELLHRPDHCDLAVAQVWGRTLDDGTYLCSQSTMHRLLRGNGESKERRRQRTHPAKKKPELMATQPNQVWSWDITKLRGPNRGEYYDLYVILDIFSRYVVGWLLAPIESAELATDFIHDAVLTQGCDRDQLTIHADRGSSMRSKPVSQLLVDLGVTRSHSRPHVTNDNPFSEAAFKTLKYCPAFPDRFGSIEDARAFCAEFFELLQPRPPTLGHRPPHPGLGPLRHGRRDQAPSAKPPRRRLRGQPHPVPAPSARSHRSCPSVAWINPPVAERGGCYRTREPKVSQIA